MAKKTKSNGTCKMVGGKMKCPHMNGKKMGKGMNGGY